MTRYRIAHEKTLGAIVASLAVLVALVLICGQSRAGEFHNAVSLQGFTGLLNTPNAELTDEGKVYLLFSDQEDAKFRAKVPRQENYIFSVGLFSIAELGGRLTEAPRAARDLSANFKVKVPFIPQGYYLPSIAFGMQDVGGGLRFLQSKYVVASEELWRLRLSLGYGFGPDRMDGVFGGAEFKAADWLYLLGEYDTEETNVGVRVITPHFFGIPVNLHATVKTSLDHKPGDLEFGVGLHFPLGSDHNNRTPITVPKVDEPSRIASAAESETKISEPDSIALSQTRSLDPAPEKLPDEDILSSLERLQEKLVADGFQNVRVGEKDGTRLVVEYENGRYTHNELDALGMAAGITLDNAPPAIRTLTLIVKKKGMRMLQLTAPLADFREFYRNADSLPRLRESLRITTDSMDDEGVRFADGPRNPSWLHSTLVVYPELKTFVGTEVGVFDYLLSVKPDLYLNTWKGAVLNARWDIPVTWSENFDDGKEFRNRRTGSRLERVMLFQAVKPAPTLMATIGAGMVLKDLYGTLNEAMWTPGDGTHRFRFKHLYSRTDDNQRGPDVYLGSYRYYFNPLETFVEGTAGKFFGQDTGFTVEMKRFFGDTSFSVYYKNSRTEDRQHVQVGGVQIAFPLSFRRDMKPYPVQVRGIDEWSYAQETEIVSPGDRNLVGRSIGINPQPPFSLDRVFYNRDRLNEIYIKNHLLRLRDAFLTYGAPR